MPADKRSFASPRVSVLMTVYNAALYLRESIDSVFAQSLKDWELIVVDDGSTDASPSIMQDYTDPRVRVFPLPKNIGRTPALRHAFDQARGHYIAVLDNDDISHPERLVRQVAFLDKHPDVALVGSWAQYIDGHGVILGEFTPPVEQDELQDCLGWMNPIVHSSAMFRRSSALAVGGYSKHLVYAQDFGLILALAQHSKIAMIDDFLCQLRFLTTSITRSRKNQAVIDGEWLINLQTAADCLPLSKKARRLNRHLRAIAEGKIGIAILATGSVLAGLQMVLRGITHDPTTLWTNGMVRRFLGMKLQFSLHPYGRLKIPVCGRVEIPQRQSVKFYTEIH